MELQSQRRKVRPGAALQHSRRFEKTLTIEHVSNRRSQLKKIAVVLSGYMIEATAFEVFTGIRGAIRELVDMA